MEDVTEISEEKVVWIACRATPGCEGNQAVIVFNKTLHDGMLPQGTAIRYRCTTCKKPFHVHR